MRRIIRRIIRGKFRGIIKGIIRGIIRGKIRAIPINVRPIFSLLFDFHVPLSLSRSKPTLVKSAGWGRRAVTTSS